MKKERFKMLKNKETSVLFLLLSVIAFSGVLSVYLIHSEIKECEFKTRNTCTFRAVPDIYDEYSAFSRKEYKL